MNPRVGLLVALWGTLWCASGIAAQPPVTALAFTPRGEALVVGSQAGLTIRSPVDSEDMTQIETSLEQIHDVRFSPDGAQLAVVGGIPAEEGVLEIFHWPSRKRRLRLTIGDDLLYSVIWLDEGKKAAVAGFEGTVTVVAFDGAGTIVSTLTGHSRGVTAVCDVGITDSSADNFQLVTGSLDQTLRVWKPATGETIRTLHNHTAPVHALVRRPATDGLPVVASISDDRTVRFWQPTIGRMMRFARLESVPLCLSWSAAGNRVLVGCADGGLSTLDPDTASLVNHQHVLDGRITSLAVSPAGGAIAVGGPKGEVRLLPPL